MQIGVNCFLLKKNIGGLKQYFHSLFRELLTNDSENNYIFFYFQHNIEELESLQNEQWKDGAILLQDQIEVLQHLDKIDLYFCPFGALWPRPVPRPSIVTLVDIQEKFFPQFFSKDDMWNRKQHFRHSTKAADRVITISNFSKDSIAEFHGISRDKIHVAYLAADESLSANAEGTKTLSFTLPDRYIFYPANRWLHKNHDNLLKALVILEKEKKIKIDCILSGFDVTNGYPLQEKIKEYGLKDQLHVVGYVSTDELKYVYQNAAMLCFPSLFEGFGLPLVEAMACGCPVVCSNASSIPEVVDDAAILFNPLDPSDIAQTISRVLSDTELSRDLIMKGYKQAKFFSVHRMADVHKEVFNLAADSYRKRRYLYYKYLYEPVRTIIHKKSFNIIN